MALLQISRLSLDRPARPSGHVVLPALEPTLDMRLAQALRAEGSLASLALVRALRAAEGSGQPLADSLLARQAVPEAKLLAHWSQLLGAPLLDPAELAAPDPRLIAALGRERCLAEGHLPLRQTGGGTLIATARPDLLLARLAEDAPQGLGRVILALAPRAALSARLLWLHSADMTEAAERRVPAEESCRSHGTGRGWAVALAAGAALIWLAAIAPRTAAGLLLGWTVATLLLATLLKLAAVLAVATRRAPAPQPPVPEHEAPLPRISMMVPLFRESEIAGALLKRLGAVDYPRERLEVLLAVEDDDRQTFGLLDKAVLPGWMRVVSVPHGTLRTKPRALNYALGFARGSIIGVWDAEDAPARDQLRAAVAHFHRAGPRVACLQGRLDFYNPRQNWLARCFTLEYGAWFRGMLPGLSRLGLVVPLGGTTLFFRRDALEEVQGWDAHNVTEDADLGLRLARHGWRVELLDSVTMEEANCHGKPWVKQRSRWLKGYAVTWAVHMRNPARLCRELGWWRFFGVQITFLATLTQYSLAPLLWLFWLDLFGLPNPLHSLLSPAALFATRATFVLCEATNLAVYLWTSRGPAHRHLLPWALLTPVYFMLGTLAAWKGLAELLSRPFFWDKTAHGLSQPEEVSAA